MRVCDSDVECIYLINARQSFSLKFCAYIYVRSSYYVYEASNWIVLNQDMWSQSKAWMNKSECVEERKNRA